MIVITTATINISRNSFVTFILLMPVSSHYVDYRYQCISIHALMIMTNPTITREELEFSLLDEMVIADSSRQCQEADEYLTVGVWVFVLK